MDDSTAMSLAALTRFPVGDARYDETLQRVAELARQAVAPASMAGITRVVNDRAGTAFFANDVVPDIDRAQAQDDEQTMVRIAQRIIDSTAAHCDHIHDLPTPMVGARPTPTEQEVKG